MAQRTVYIPLIENYFVKSVLCEFQWFAGFSTSQAQRSIRALHESARMMGYAPLLEISSKSYQLHGVDLSAFNLMLAAQDGSRMSVECAFQGSKVFESGGPYQDLYTVTSREAKRDERLRASGNVVGFRYFDVEFPTEPKTAFYDWLYLTALVQNLGVSDVLMDYVGFTDIAFNPKRSINCQARAAALYVVWRKMGILEDAMRTVKSYLQMISKQRA